MGELAVPGGTSTETTAGKTAKRTKRRTKAGKKDDHVSPDDCPPPLDTSEGGGERESEEWRPQRLLTDWGLTDDVVTIGNGERYYFFKIPHKVRQWWW